MQPETAICVLKLRLGACLSAPTKRLAHDLHLASQAQNRAANAMIRHWERWCEDHLFQEKPIHIKGKRNPVTGEPARSRDAIVRAQFVPETYQLPKGFSTELYHAGCAVAPELSANIVASLSNSILSNVNKRVPFGHAGKAKRVWQGILGCELAKPCFRQKELSVPNSQAKLTLTDSGYSVSFPIWSRQAGRGKTSHVCRLPSARLTPGYKKILLKIVAGDWKLADSTLHYHEPKSRRGKGHWAIHLTYHRTPEPLPVDPSRVAALTACGKDAEKPFEIATDGAFPWKLGDVAVYLHEVHRLESRRESMRHRHRDKAAMRGHGRERVEATIRPLTRAMRNLYGRFQWRIVAEVIRYCERNNCGTVEFDEPSRGQKAAGWFGVEGRPWNWTGFTSRLERKLWVNGIVLRESGGDERSPVDRSRDAKEETAESNGDMANGSAKKRGRKPAGSRGPGRKAGSGNG